MSKTLKRTPFQAQQEMKKITTICKALAALPEQSLDAYNALRFNVAPRRSG